MTEVVRPYRGVSAEERRTQRRTQLLEACLDVVGEVGVGEVTAEAVCTRAGLSKRYFYESFGDREAILVAALDEFFVVAREAILPALTDPVDSVEERLRRTVAALVGAVSADARAARLYVESPRHAALEQRRSIAYVEFADLVLRHALVADPADPRSQAAALLIVSGTTEVIARWLAGSIALDESGLVETISGIGLASAQALARQQVQG